MGRIAKRKKKAVINNDIQDEDLSKNNDAQIQNSAQVVNDNIMQQDENVEVVESERNSNGDEGPIVRKKSRGPTKAKRLPSNISSRIEVEFNRLAEPIGDGSVKLSSYLGPLVRKCVPVTLDGWKHLSNELKVVLWESIQV